ncbi:MAG: hypothetical protein KDA75_07045, partial [Planctomycetaceae bacterium]|nr:hypothetical protein [Planctomycetaceae bacterium]
PFQEVVVDVHKRAEIDTPAFREFVEEAIAHYVEKVEQQEQAPAEAVMPWKVLGKKWHLSRKGFPSKKRVHWDAAVLEQLLNVLETSLNGCEPDWSNKTQITWKTADGGPLAELQTKRREGVFLTLLTAPGKIALGQIADLGAEREITTHRSGQDAVRVKFTLTDEVKRSELIKLLKQVHA